jgi:hypothetical protein
MGSGSRVIDVDRNHHGLQYPTNVENQAVAPGKKELQQGFQFTGSSRQKKLRGELRHINSKSGLRLWDHQRRSTITLPFTSREILLSKPSRVVRD